MSTSGYHRYEIVNKNINLLEGKSNQNLKFSLIKPILYNILNDTKDTLTVTDLGASNGLYSFYCALNGAKFVNSIEKGDEKCGGGNSLNILNKNISRNNIQNINVHDVDIINYTEKSDVVIALAIIHHLMDNFKNLNELISFIGNLTKKYLIIEWIGHGHFVEKKNVNLDIFLKELNSNFDSVEKIGQSRYDKLRYVYLCKK